MGSPQASTSQISSSVFATQGNISALHQPLGSCAVIEISNRKIPRSMQAHMWVSQMEGT